MATNLSSVLHSVKRWHLNGTDYEPPQTQTMRSETLFSTWTPLNNKASNLQLFEKRIGLVLHWFDLWTDRQRKHLLHSLLTHCTKSQLKYCRDLLIETVPVTRVDFTTVLPRFLSLYVLSFLNPRDLCSTAQVCWNWRILAEQDCLWVSRCIRKGWFLPYTPGDREYGAWKKHYVSCVSTLDLLTPREAAEQYGTLNQKISGATEEEEERLKERRIRQMIRERLQHEKRELMRTRKAWGSYTIASAKQGSVQPRIPTFESASQGFWSSPPWPSRTIPSPSLSHSVDVGRSTSTTYCNLDRAEVSSPARLSKTSDALSSFTLSASLQVTSRNAHVCPHLLLLISDRIPAYEMVLSGVKAGVIVILFDHRQTLSALLNQVERALCGQRAQRLGVVAPGGTEEIQLLHRSKLSEQTLLAPDHREFWEKICVWLTQTEAGGGIDFFCPLAASASGVALMQNLFTLTGLEVRAPVGLATGSFQNILGEWSDSSVSTRLSKPVCEQASSPALDYIHESVLQSWCTQAQWMEQSLSELRLSLGTKLQRVTADVRGRALGHCFWEKVCPKAIHFSTELSEALTEGLTALTTQEETRPLQFISSFLTKYIEMKNAGEREEAPGPQSITQSCITPLPLTVLDWRGSVVRELHESECLYLNRLDAIKEVYQEPLTAAMNSNQAILSFADIHIILSPVSQILELNRAFQLDLQSKLLQWSAQQCVGEVFVKFCSKLRVYTNYFNNYPTALHTIDKCREMKPLFRAFLKRTDRTLATFMFSLQELLLCPVWRMEEYVTLLQALSLQTHPGHPDHIHLSSALNTLLQYRQFLHKLKRNSERDRLLEDTQQMIQGCPNLIEGNRQLITTQNCALFTSPDEHVPDSVWPFEHVADVGLFLFTDALVLTRLNLHQVPFTVAQQCSHTFLASVALSSLTVREITHSRYVSHAFVLEGPCRSWVCATERAVDRDVFLCVLRSAIETALNVHQ